eukprot:6773286-Prymnesium_polylepis.1
METSSGSRRGRARTLEEMRARVSASATIAECASGMPVSGEQGACPSFSICQRRCARALRS